MNSTKTSSTAAEARRNTKAELAYRSIRYIGGVAGQPTYEQWMAESTSEAGTWYTVTHDLAHDGNRYRCSCLAGQHDRQCVHVLAAQRKVNDRRAAYERDTRAGGYGYNDTLNLMFGVQATSEY